MKEMQKTFKNFFEEFDNALSNQSTIHLHAADAHI